MKWVFDKLIKMFKKVGSFIELDSRRCTNWLIKMGIGQEQAKAEEKKEEKTEEKPPLPFVLFVDLHCVGCAKKIEKSLSNIRGLPSLLSYK